MSIIELDSSSINLTGVILSSTIMIRNPHKLLAVLFQLEMNPEFLEIEPKRGMVLAEERKIIKMRCKSQFLSSMQGLEGKSHVLILRASYSSEYNRKIMAKNGLRGWSVISKQLEEISLPVYFNFSKEIERIKCDSRNSSLKKSRKMNSFQKFRESSLKKTKNSRLNEDLDFIFRNQQFGKTYASNYSNKDKHNQAKQDKIKTSPQFYSNIPQKSNHQYSPFKDPPTNKNQQQLDYKINILQIPNNYQITSSKQYKVQSNFPPNKRLYSRNFELIILAAIAAISFALGQSFS